MSSAATSVPQPRRFPRDFAVAAAAGSAVMVASLGNFLNHNDYSIFTPEVGIAMLALVAAAVVIGLLYRVAGRLGRCLLDVVLLYLALDLNFDVGIPVALGAIAAAILLNRHLLPALGIVFSVVLVTQILVPAVGGEEADASAAPASAASASEAPTLVHLILDEHIGIEGLPAERPEAAAMRRELLAFYEKNGFRLFGGAYNEYMHTINAIPYLLNFGVEQPWRLENKDAGVALESNAYFDQLRALGYAINVYQTDFVDYCTGQQVNVCHEFRSAGLQSIAASDLAAGEKAQVILFSFWSLSETVEILSSLYDFGAVMLSRSGLADLPVIDMDLYRRTSTAVALDAADQLTADLRNAAPGEAYFAHLLLPHYPYATDRNCSVKELEAWRKRRSARHDVADRQDAYFDQLGCVLTKVDGIVKALAGKPSIVVLHGDHGSRITTRDPTVENAGRFTDEDLIAGYSTLFAVRAPALAPSYETARLPIARLLEVVARSGFRSADLDVAADFEPTVVIEDINWQPIERQALPAAWAHP